MAVIIVDMNFPDCCSACEFARPEANIGTYCVRHPEKEYIEYGMPKPDWCPIRKVNEEQLSNFKVIYNEH